MRKLEKLYMNGPAAFGSIKNLVTASGLHKSQVERFLEAQPSYTKYLTPRTSFPRLKVIAYRINEIWSMDVAYVDKLAKYNKNVKYLLVAVDVLSRYLRVEPLKNKTAKEASNAFKKMTKAKQPEKVWTDKGTEFKGEFRQLCLKRGIHTYTTNSETKSAYAERQIRSLKNIIYKYLEKKWTWMYIDKLPDFVRIINTRRNRTIGLAPYKVTKKDVPRIISETSQSSLARLKKPKFKIGDIVRIAKEDLPFKKGYKQHFTDETFTIVAIPTIRPPTYNLQDSSKEAILGKFYEPELVKISE